MRKLYFLAGLAVIGIGLAGWSVMGSAQTIPELPPVPTIEKTDPRLDDIAPLPAGKPVSTELPAIPGLKLPDSKPTPRPSSSTSLPPVEPTPASRPSSTMLPPVEPTPTPTPRPSKREPLPPLPEEPKPSVREPLPGTKSPEEKPLIIGDPFPVKEEPTKPITKPATPIKSPSDVILPPIEEKKPTDNKLGTEAIKPVSSGTGGLIINNNHTSNTTSDKLPAAMVSHPSMSKQEPSVSLEWIGPPAVKAGGSGDYTLMVRNTCSIPVQKVVVQVRVPAGATVAGTEPKAEGAEGVLLWDLGTLLSRQDKALKMRFNTPAKGEMNCQAWVTFTGSAAMKVQIREPKLLVKTSIPEKVYVGEPATLGIAVSNPGDHPAEGVKLVVHLPEGLESTRGPRSTIEVGTLAAGETRTVQVVCAAKSSGAQKCEVFAENSDGLKANDASSVNVVQPKIDIELTGPKMRYLGRKAIFNVKVTNPGDAPASNVFITEIIPTGFKFVAADNGGQHDFAARTVKWFLGELAAGASKEVKVELEAMTSGEFHHKVIATASRGIRTEKEMSTKVEGLSALLMEVVDTEDPIEVKADTAYEIRITNTGSKDETDVKLVCSVPAQFKVKAVSGPVKYSVVGNEIVFEPISKLAPRADATFKVVVTAVAKGDARFKATLTSAGLTEPVIKQESTRVYED
ncbi:MAG: hypothetical protein N2112_15105 [Gemmataceae bacterium]|jgi:uncharacterized repeat protein (TIGR01451 family)|nr:hypothetical protein [Gemmataceae bacterium]